MPEEKQNTELCEVMKNINLYHVVLKVGGCPYITLVP